MLTVLLLGLGCVEGTIGGTQDTPDTDVSQYANCTGASEVDGELDGIIDETHVLVRDANGHLVHYTTDADADGTDELILDYVVTEGGETLVLDKDEDADGTVDMRWTYLRDTDDWLEFVEYDEGLDGELEWLTTVATEWTADDLPAEVTSTKDALLDGTPDEIEHRVYDHDATGYWITVENDYAADGVIETHHEVRFDLEGRKLEVRFDDGVDGTDNRVNEYLYTDDGQVYRIDVTEDLADGGTQLTRVFHEYDAASRISEINVDDGGDGSLDGATTFVWDCP